LDHLEIINNDGLEIDAIEASPEPLAAISRADACS
jgi:hypothetical protein